MNGARTNPATSVVKIITAAISPPTRLAISGPIPIPSRCSSVAGVVMLFHSPMSRMKRTLPDAVDGEIEPKTASWRTHHGAMTSANSADAADTPPRAGSRAARVPADRQARQRSHANDEAERGQDEQAVIARQRGETGEQAGEDEGARRSPEAARAHPQRRGDQRLVEGEVVRLDHVDRGQQRDRDQDARRRRPRCRAIRRRARSPTSAGRPARRSGRTAAPTPRRRRRRPPGTGPGRWTRAASSGRSRGSAGRGRRDRAADLREDPDEVDVEAAARRERSRDVDVVGRIGIRRVREVPDEHHPDGEGEPVQQ